VKQEKYRIEIQGLKLGSYSYDFSLADNFFQLFPGSLVQRAALTLHIELEKRAHIIELNLGFAGWVELECDRSLELFEEPISLNQKLLYKFGEEPGEVDEQLTILAWNEQHIELAQAVYDLIILSLPMKKLHPKFRETPDVISDDEEVIQIYTTLTDEEAEALQKDAENTIDPRWAALLSLKKSEDQE
jgi:uncharacterized protein